MHAADPAAIDLRHLLMATALRPFFGGRSLRQRLGLAYLLRDEAIVVVAITAWRRDLLLAVLAGVATVALPRWIRPA